MYSCQLRQDSHRHSSVLDMIHCAQLYTHALFSISASGPEKLFLFAIGLYAVMVHAFSKNTLPMHIITFVGGLLADSSPFLKFNSRLYVNKTVVLMQIFKMAWLCVAVRCALASHDNRLYFREHVDIVCGAARYMYSEKFWRMFE